MNPKEELVALKAKLKARKGKSGFKENVEAVEARIAQLEAQIGPD